MAEFGERFDLKAFKAAYESRTCRSQAQSSLG
jgi:hypothetical protein